MELMNQPPARRRMTPDDRREEIVRAARRLFARSAYSAVSVAEIAKAAGASASLVIFYFGSKHALYLEVLGVSVDELRAGLLGPPGPPSMDRLRAILEWYAAWAHDNRDGFLSLLRGEHEVVAPEAADLFEGLRADVTARTIADLIELGWSAIEGDPVVELGIRGYLGYVDTTIIRWLSLPPAEAAAIDGPTIADLGIGAFSGCLAALAARPRPTSA
jgi:AcrR family transcriptional regulator